MKMLNMDFQESEKLRQYSNKQILLVGEGDFSFSLSIAKAFGSATNITATSLDSRGSSKSKIINHFISSDIIYNNHMQTQQ